MPPGPLRPPPHHHGKTASQLPPPIPLGPRRSSPDAPRQPISRRQGWSSLAATVLLTLLLGLVWRLGTIEVTLEIDGETRNLRTRAGTIGALLVEQDVAVDAGDLVMPGPDSRLAAGDRVLVQRARPVRVVADGRVIRLGSHGRSALAVLQEAGVALGPRDAVKVNDQLWPVDRPVLAAPRPQELPRPVSRRAGLVRVAEAAGLAQEEPSLPESELAPGPPLPGADPSWELEVFRAQPVTLVEDGVPIEIAIAGDTVAEGLTAGGFEIRPEDEVLPAPDAPLRAGMRISLRRALPFTLLTAGEREELLARADTVGEALERTGRPLLGRDYSIPEAETALTPGLTVEVVRVKEDVLVQEVSIPFDTITEPDAEMALDETQVLRPGENGLKTQRIAITYENGVEVDRQLEEEIVLREPVAQILAYGTRIVWRTVNTEQGPKRYWRHLRVYATSYSASRAGTPKSVPWYGRTRLGWEMRHGIVAVDPRYIPLRAELFVPGYGLGVAGDTGGGIKRYHIDLGFDDDNYESWHQWVDLYLLEPLPPERDIPWILP